MKSQQPIKKFLKRTTLFVACTIALCSLLLYTYHIGPDHYVRGLQDKLDRLSNSENRKLVFVGDSNLAFGIDSSVLSEELGIEVHNTGILRGVGLAFALNQVKPFLQSGDKLIICPAYTQTTTGHGGIYGNDKLGFVLKTYPSHISSLSEPEQLGPVLSGVSKIIRSPLKKILGLNTEPGFMYTRSGFNEYGDYKSNKYESSRFKPDYYKDYINPLLNRKAIFWLNEEIELLKERGIDTQFMYPAYPKSIYRAKNHEFDKFDKDLRELIDCEVLGTKEDFLYHDSLFFDTQFHMNDIGRIVRTNDILRVISNHSNFKDL